MIVFGCFSRITKCLGRTQTRTRDRMWYNTFVEVMRMLTDRKTDSKEAQDRQQRQVIAFTDQLKEIMSAAEVSKLEVTGDNSVDSRIHKKVTHELNTHSTSHMIVRIRIVAIFFYPALSECAQLQLKYINALN